MNLSSEFKADWKSKIKSQEGCWSSETLGGILFSLVLTSHVGLWSLSFLAYCCLPLYPVEVSPVSLFSQGFFSLIRTPVILGEVKWSESCSVMSDSLRPCGLYSPWNSLGQNTGVGSLSLLQGIFPTQGSNPGLLHSRRILYQLSHKGSPRILE